MHRHLNLIKSDYAQREKRKLPRFPFCYLTFKSNAIESNHVFEVKDISFSGMQIALKNGEHGHAQGDLLSGKIHWSKSEVEISGKIVWSNESHLGIEFPKTQKVQNELQELLSIENIVSKLRPLHREEYALDLPINLKYWLRADGPIELFVWQHGHGELAKVQLILMENFVEWQDGVGLATGKTFSKRSLETPLNAEDEFEFELDSQIDLDKLDFAKRFMAAVGEDLLPQKVIDFIRFKLGN